MTIPAPYVPWLRSTEYQEADTEFRRTLDTLGEEDHDSYNAARANYLTVAEQHITALTDSTRTFEGLQEHLAALAAHNPAAALAVTMHGIAALRPHLLAPISRLDVEAWAGRTLTDDEHTRLAVALHNSTAPDTVTTILAAIEDSDGTDDAQEQDQ